MLKKRWKDPTKLGYTKLSIPKVLHNKLFEYRQITWKDSYEYYIKDDYVLIYNFNSLLLKASILLLLPLITVLFIIEGDLTEFKKDLLMVFFSKRYGGYSSGTIKSYSELLKDKGVTIG